jgi:MscS family membrane protein
MDTIYALFNSTLMGYETGTLLISFGILFSFVVFRNLVTRVIFRTLSHLASKTATDYDDRVLEALQKPVSLYLLIIGSYLSILVLPLNIEWQNIVDLAFKGFTVFIVFWGLLRLLDVFCDILIDVTGKKGSSVSGFVPLLKKSIRIFLITLGILMILDNLGYSISGVLTGLGIGGAAFAFAAKDSIANLYGSVALALDRPFKVGDWIQVGSDVDGDVEEIGLRSTKIRTWPKTVLSIPNAVLANEKINNWSRMPKRRVKQVIGVTYETQPHQMEEIVEAIRALLRADEGVQQDFILVNFTDFGASSLDILVYYFTDTIKWLEHMDIRQRINIKIMKTLKDHGLSVAFPTRSVYLERSGSIKMDESGLPGDFGADKPM